jgi:hypothetical protein
MVGHSGNSVRITKNPIIGVGVEETYGTIDVPVLLCNLWAATYMLIKTLNEGFGYINELPEDHELYHFNFNNVSDTKKNRIKKLFKEER